MTLRIFLIALTIASGCVMEGQSDERALQSKNAVVYVESISDQHGVAAGGFGDIVLLDVDSGRSFKVTDDAFYDFCPRWSTDGSRIAFLSAREGSSRSLKLGGIAASRCIYVFDLSSRKIRKVGESLKKLMGSDVTVYDWLSEQSIVVPFRNRLYELNVQRDQPYLLEEFPLLDGLTIDEAEVSPDGMKIAARFRRTHTLLGIVIMTKIGTEFDATIIEDSTEWVRLCDWTQDGESICYVKDEEFYAYNTKTLDGRKYQVATKVKDKWVLSLRYLPMGDMVFFARLPVESGLNVNVYDVVKDSIHNVTANGRKKEDLDVRPANFPPPKR